MKYHLNLQGEESASVDFVLGPYDSTDEAYCALDRIKQQCPDALFAPVTESHDPVTRRPMTERAPNPPENDELPRSSDPNRLCDGTAVTTCCGAFATFHDDVPCCKVCWREVG